MSCVDCVGYDNKEKGLLEEHVQGYRSALGRNKTCILMLFEAGIGQAYPERTVIEE